MMVVIVTVVVTFAVCREGNHINKSLSTLSLVIKKLTEGDAHIPYRDSKLTRLLKHALGGNSKTLTLCNVSAAAIHMEETHSTLRFASACKKVMRGPGYHLHAYAGNNGLRGESVPTGEQLCYCE